jgi:hypothetical protein
MLATMLSTKTLGLMTLSRWAFVGRFLLPVSLLLLAATASAQETCFEPISLPMFTDASDLISQTLPQNPPPATSGTPAAPTTVQPSNPTPKEQSASSPPPQPKRILGVMPNFRAVSAGAIPPPPTPKQAFLIATNQSFDYSSFIFVGLTSMIAEGDNAHPPLRKGVAGFGRYYWRGFLDKADGNYLVIFALPSVFHQDERYYAMGHGSFLKRFAYSATRVFITPNYDGHNSFNASELLGRGIAQGISLAYYPSQTRTLGGIGSKYGYAILRDAATNIFREFWPDIAVHVLHRHP